MIYHGISIKMFPTVAFAFIALLAPGLISAFPASEPSPQSGSESNSGPSSQGSSGAASLAIALYSDAGW